MAEIPTSSLPSPMEGRGGYNRNSGVQAGVLLPALAMLEEAARNVELPPKEAPIVLVDYGSSQGHNSLLPLQTAIEVIRQRIGPKKEISVIHTDLPENDFTSLFETLITDTESYLRNDEAVFTSAVGRSYFGQILPTGSVNLGWSSWAIQWLSRVPATIPDQVQVAFSRDSAARAAFTRQAAADWHAFLLARERELARGAKLVILAMAADDDGEFGYRPLLNAMYSTLEEMVDSGFLLAEEVKRMAIPVVARNREEFSAPFAFDRRFHGLRLEEIDIFYGQDHIWSDFEKNRDALSFASQWAAFSRASVFPTLTGSIDGGKNGSRSASFNSLLEGGMIARLAAEPQPMLIPLGRLLISKEE